MRLPPGPGAQAKDHFFLQDFISWFVSNEVLRPLFFSLGFGFLVVRFLPFPLTSPPAHHPRFWLTLCCGFWGRTGWPVGPQEATPTPQMTGGDDAMLHSEYAKEAARLAAEGQAATMAPKVLPSLCVAWRPFA